MEVDSPEATVRDKGRRVRERVAMMRKLSSKGDYVLI